MSYLIKTCAICGHKYHVHDNGDVTNVCEHVQVKGRRAGRSLYSKSVADTKELDAMYEEERVNKMIHKK